LHAQRLCPDFRGALLGQGSSPRPGRDPAAPRRALRGRHPAGPLDGAHGAGSGRAERRSVGGIRGRRANANRRAQGARRRPGRTLTPDTSVVEGSAQRAEDAAEERRTSPLELLWDLVFVFAITQVTTLLANHLTWTGFGQSVLVLALVWWA